MLTRIRRVLRERLSEDPIITYLSIAVALALLAALGIVVFHLFRTPLGPNRSSSVVTPTPGPIVGPTATPMPKPSATSAATLAPFVAEGELYLPLVVHSIPSPTVTPTPTKAPPTPTPTPTPVDFAAVRQELQAQGKDLATVKIGFHVGPGGNARGLETYLSALAQVGVPAVVKSVDNYGVCAQALRESADHVAIFRLTGGEVELPDYDVPPGQAAEEHWARVKAALPPEFDRRTWLEVMNEPDKGRADWLGWFAHRMAELALRDGYRFAAFGWSSGEPEPEDWQTPGMLAFLRLAGQHPEQIGVALHEYSYDVNNIANQYPSLVGRFQTLFQICDTQGIPRPTVFITEWGWEHTSVPPVEQAMEDIAWASELYAAYPEVRGAAIWYLGGQYGDISKVVQRLIVPLRYYVWTEYFVIEPGQKPTNPAQFAP
ncbi:MAG: hypothetical protein R6X31_05980 [Anaerolineae bacterium]